MRRLLFAALLLLAGLLPGNAQTCPTAPAGTSNNQCASTAFVQTAVATANLTVGTTQIFNGSTGRILYQNGSVLGEMTTTGSGTVAVLALSPTITTPTLVSPALSGTVTGNNTIPLAILSQIGANTMLGNWSGSTANVSAQSMPSCPDTGSNHLNYVSGTGVTCGTADPASTLIVGSTTISGGTTTRILYDNAGVLGEYTLTGSGTVVVMATGPTISALTVTGSFTATGLVGNASLVNPATTVNGQTCTLGSTCTVTAAATSITVGSTTISGGTTTRILYDNAGVLGEYTLSGSGTVVAMQTSPQFVTPDVGVATGTSISTTGVHQAFNATAIPAGGTAGSGYRFSSTSNFGTFFGSGAPTLSAAQGSLYLRSDGPPYYNNNGSTGWTSLAAGSGTVTDITCGSGLTCSATPITTSGTITPDRASASDIWSGTAYKMVEGAGLKASGYLQNLASASPSVAVNFSAGANFSLTLTGSVQLANPTNVSVGDTGCIFIAKDVTSRTLSYDSNWKFAGGVSPALSTTTTTVPDVLCYLARTSTFIWAVMTKALN